MRPRPHCIAEVKPFGRPRCGRLLHIKTEPSGLAPRALTTRSKRKGTQSETRSAGRGRQGREKLIHRPTPRGRGAAKTDTARPGTRQFLGGLVQGLFANHSFRSTFARHDELGRAA
jgi:hypothetical protein